MESKTKIKVVVIIFLLCSVVLCLFLNIKQKSFASISSVNLDCITVNYTYVIDGDSIRDTMSITDKKDLLTIVSLIKGSKKKYGVCGCRWYSIVLHYANDSEITVFWPHGIDFEKNSGWFRYEINETELIKLWNILIKHGVDNRSIPPEIRKLKKKLTI